jgi:predicted dehydrogenase/threonine dehydrogenase-like Zn-dependent dehydrogenase
VKQVVIQRGRAVADDVPAPLVEQGTALVGVVRSCISVGTELSGLKRTATPAWRLAMKYPDQAKKALETVATLGVTRTWSLIQGQLSAGLPVGYSAAGVVLQTGEGLEGFNVGDRVACAGAQCAHHAEVIRVPQNLMTRIPDEVSFDDASTVALGAIAMQGVRRAQPTLGETFVVIGLGALGQLTSQLLRASGCRVIGIDLDQERLSLATRLGMSSAIVAEESVDIAQVTRLTGGAGADGVIVTAATASSAVMSNAFKMCRKKGRVVLVGDVGLKLNRGDIYAKELDFFISCSYGPGRYDGQYEERGVDYPLGYVRWTENRNMAEYLRLIGDKRLQVQPLIAAVHPAQNADSAYQALQSKERPLLVLLSYPEAAAAGTSLDRVVRNPKPMPARASTVRMALVGAGGFAKGMHLPNLQALGSLCHLRAVASRSGHNAVATARRWGAEYATTDFQEVLGDQNVDAVIIATRHNLHAAMALAALRAGKHVLLEKPLALTAAELDEILAFFESAGADESRPLLLTGFNRRFSPYARRIRQWTAQRTNPMIINYRMNAGYIPGDHWVHSAEGGGRNLGEACHIYDLMTYLTGSRVASVEATGLEPSTPHYKRQDNFVATIRFEDGSVGTLTYTSLGAKEHPKERAEIFVDGTVIELDDYKSLQVSGAKRPSLKTRLPEKGQKEELEAFARAIKDGGESPIALWQQDQATRIALDVERLLNRGR